MQSPLASPFTGVHRRLKSFGLLLCLPALAAVIDRVAVVVGTDVITETEVLREVRLTEFLNHEPLDLSPEKRRGAAERLVDQQLIRNEMKTASFPAPAPAQADALLEKLHQERYPTDGEFPNELAKYGVTEDELKQHLAWQAAVIGFTDIRFPSMTPAPQDQSANRYQNGADPAQSSTVDQQLDTWLKEVRSQTRVQFKKEAFQ